MRHNKKKVSERKLVYKRNKGKVYDPPCELKPLKPIIASEKAFTMTLLPTIIGNSPQCHEKGRIEWTNIINSKVTFTNEVKSGNENLIDDIADDVTAASEIQSE